MTWKKSWVARIQVAIRQCSRNFRPVPKDLHSVPLHQDVDSIKRYQQRLVHISTTIGYHIYAILQLKYIKSLGVHFSVSHIPGWSWLLLVSEPPQDHDQQMFRWSQLPHHGGCWVKQWSCSPPRLRHTTSGPCCQPGRCDMGSVWRAWKVVDSFCTHLRGWTQFGFCVRFGDDELMLSDLFSWRWCDIHYTFQQIILMKKRLSSQQWFLLAPGSSFCLEQWRNCQLPAFLQPGRRIPRWIGPWKTPPRWIGALRFVRPGSLVTSQVGGNIGEMG